MNGAESIIKLVTSIGLIPAFLAWILWEIHTYLPRFLEVLQEFADSQHQIIYLLDILIRQHS